VGSNARGHAAWLNTEGTTVSWHYTVDDTETVQHLPETEDGFHAGDGSGNGNRNSIGIEMCVNSDGDFPTTIKRTQQLVADICQRRGIPLSHVVQHNNWSGKNCPSQIRSGVPMTWATFMSGITIQATTASETLEVATVGDIVYVLGNTNNLYAYDYQWRQITPNSPSAFSNGSAAVYNGEIYFAGSAANFRKFTPSTGQWTQLANAWVDCAFSSMEVIGDAIFVIGGNTSPFRQIMRYTPATDTWDRVATLPTPYSARNAVTAVIRGDLYIWNTEGVLNIYNPRRNLWETRQTELPESTAAGNVTVGESSIVIGGENPHYQYTPSTRFIQQIIAAVKAGQIIRYQNAANVGVLRLNGNVLQSGVNNTAAADGDVITDVTANAADIIRGWIN
jgi:hypothetical protein